MDPARIKIDPWTPLSYKASIGDAAAPADTALAPTWVGTDHQRRLSAYKVLHAYTANASRIFRELVSGEVDPTADDMREYGDAALLVAQTLSALLGDQQLPMVDGADVGQGADNIDEGTTDEAPAPDEVDSEAGLEQQDWLRQWCNDERFGLKLVECERNAVRLGDGLYVLDISYKRGRVKLMSLNPGFYFPVLSDDIDDEYPIKVHLAWEVERDDEPGFVWVRRITYELDVLPDGGTVDHPWNAESTDLTCYKTDVTWKMRAGAARSVDDLELHAEDATFATFTDAQGEEHDYDHADLGFDFVPVVHIPNTIALEDHFGQSVLSTVLQVIDDLQDADTDLKASAATAGKPPVAVSGARLDVAPKWQPGDVWDLGENGKLSTIDTSAAIAALMLYVEFLLKRLSINSRLPEALLGRVKPSEVPSGLAMRLGFGPLETLVREMRMVRDEEKYPILFRFVWRMSLAAGFPDVPPGWNGAWLEFGSFLPSDQAAAVEAVQLLLTQSPKPGISLETAVRMLQMAGFPIESVDDEIELIEGRDFEGADHLLDATGDEDAVFDYLHRDRPPQPPVSPLPPVVSPLPSLDLTGQPTSQPPAPDLGPPETPGSAQ